MATKRSADELPLCPYGKRCFRKNPKHFEEFNHSSSSSQDTSTTTKSRPTILNSPKLPTCKYGVNCFRKNLLHFAEYWHPFIAPKSVVDDDKSDSDNDQTKSSKSEPDKRTTVTNKPEKTTKKNSGVAVEKSKKSEEDPALADTDECETEDEEEDRKVKSMMKRGLSLVRNYSQLTEQERKDLVERAIQAKLHLEKELESAKKEIEEKKKRVEELQEEYNKGLTLKGEIEAMKDNKMVLIPLHPKRSYMDKSAEEIHFRLAESQFYRLLDADRSDYRVKLVEYVVNPILSEKFNKARLEIKNNRSEKLSNPVLAFHGTKEENIMKICETGFLKPGAIGFHHQTDNGWYGKGIYFSEFASYSMDYIDGASKLLLCQVLAGKPFVCKGLCQGQANCEPGFDSHMSPDKKEIVIFESERILPCYIVHYTDDEDTFTYNSDKSATMDDFKSAKKKKATKIFEGEVFHFFGNISCLYTTKDLTDLVQKHGAKLGMKYYTVLVTTGDDFDECGDKITDAINKQIPCVGTKYITDCINKNMMLNKEDYTFE